MKKTVNDIFIIDHLSLISKEYSSHKDEQINALIKRLKRNIKIDIILKDDEREKEN